MKIFLATFVGLIACFLSVGLIERLGFMIFPIPFKIDPNNFEEKQNLISVGSYVTVIIAHGIGLLIGLIIARLIDRNTLLPIGIIATFMLIEVIANLFMVSNPVWFSVFEPVVVSTIGIIFISKVKNEQP